MPPLEPQLRIPFLFFKEEPSPDEAQIPSEESTGADAAIKNTRGYAVENAEINGMNFAHRTCSLYWMNSGYFLFVLLKKKKIS